ncbi:Nucleoporin Nup43 [Haplosporangium sp. Z 767]|nr:Nucleoporin Nup43 [Haplosporangium sp. Z 767]KAF9196260.1 Nucleoporin Nup43 [Haplosporangium sp. Z 11]
MTRKEINQFTVPRKVSKVRWLEKAAFPTKDLHFATSLHLDGKASFKTDTSNTIVIWSCQNQRQFEITRAEDVKSTFVPFKLAEASHQGEVLDMRVIEGQDPLLVTASSTGEIGLYKSKLQASRRADSPSIEFVDTHRHHGFHNKDTAEATSLSVRPQALNEIASVGEDSRLVLLSIDNIQKSLQRSDHIGAGFSAVCWRSSSSLAVTTKIGQLRLFDRRDISKPVLLSTPKSYQRDPLTCVAQHPTEPYRLATGNEDGSVAVWDVRNLSQPEIAGIKVHNSIVWEVQFHPNQPDKLLSCSQDGSLATLDWRQAVKDHVNDTRNTLDDSVATYWTSIRNVLSVNSLDYHNRANVLLAGSDSGGILESVQ